MNSLLPTTGTNALLEQLCPFVPDGFLPERWPHTATGGRPGHLSAAQWWPVHLLAPLLEGLDPSVPTIALINATDLPAACRGFKKVDRHLLHRARRAARAYAQHRPVGFALSQTLLETVTALAKPLRTAPDGAPIRTRHTSPLHISAKAQSENSPCVRCTCN